MSVTQKLTAPVRLVLRTGRDAAGTLVELGRHVVDRVTSGSPDDDHRSPTPPTRTTPPADSIGVPSRPAAPPSAPVAPATPAPADAPAPAASDEPDQPEFQPAHIDEEPTLVYSSADEGAQDGAGPTLRIGEPWNGYRGMNAPDVVDRLAVADAATLAAVQLFESANRSRKSVLAAVDQRLTTIS